VDEKYIITPARHLMKRRFESIQNLFGCRDVCRHLVYWDTTMWQESKLINQPITGTTDLRT